MMIRGIGMMALWIIIPLAIIALVVWAVVSFARSAGQPNSAALQNETPLEVLRRRYAVGEIKTEQFEEMKCAIGVCNFSNGLAH